MGKKLRISLSGIVAGYRSLNSYRASPTTPTDARADSAPAPPPPPASPADVGVHCIELPEGLSCPVYPLVDGDGATLNRRAFCNAVLKAVGNQPSGEPFYVKMGGEVGHFDPRRPPTPGVCMVLNRPDDPDAPPLRVRIAARNEHCACAQAAPVYSSADGTSACAHCGHVFPDGPPRYALPVEYTADRPDVVDAAATPGRHDVRRKRKRPHGAPVAAPVDSCSLFQESDAWCGEGLGGQPGQYFEATSKQIDALIGPGRHLDVNRRLDARARALARLVTHCRFGRECRSGGKCQLRFVAAHACACACVRLAAVEERRRALTAGGEPPTLPASIIRSVDAQCPNAVSHVMPWLTALAQRPRVERDAACAACAYVYQVAAGTPCAPATPSSASEASSSPATPSGSVSPTTPERRCRVHDALRALVRRATDPKQRQHATRAYQVLLAAMPADPALEHALLGTADAARLSAERVAACAMRWVAAQLGLPVDVDEGDGVDEVEARHVAFLGGRRAPVLDARYLGGALLA